MGYNLSKKEVTLNRIGVNKLYSVNVKPLKEVLADVPLVTDQLTLYELYKSFVFQRFTVINISRRYHKVEKLSFLIANQMQFETEKPTHRTRIGVYCLIVCSGRHFWGADV